MHIKLLLLILWLETTSVSVALQLIQDEENLAHFETFPVETILTQLGKLPKIRCVSTSFSSSKYTLILVEA